MAPESLSNTITPSANCKICSNMNTLLDHQCNVFMLKKDSNPFDKKLKVDLSEIRISFNPRSKRDIKRDLGIVERDGETFIDGRKADRLRFFLVPNADGTQCETFWWNAYVATHAILGPSLPMNVDEAESGFVEIVSTEWKLYDTDSNGFFYPEFVKDFILKLIG